jgi:hypothetical protein
VADQQDTPVPVAELNRREATVSMMEACDKAAGITDKGTVSARAAVNAARRNGGWRG